jgi:hypothetical protein
VEHLSFTFEIKEKIIKYETIDWDNFAWFARCETKQAVDQVLNEVNKSICDKQVTDIIMELNDLTLTK